MKNANQIILIIAGLLLIYWYYLEIRARKREDALILGTIPPEMAAAVINAAGGKVYYQGSADSINYYGYLGGPKK